jgi:hypothetical protein
LFDICNALHVFSSQFCNQLSTMLLQILKNFMSEYRFVVGFRRTHRYYGITLRGQKFFNSDVVFDIFAGYVHKRDSFHLGGCHFRVLNDNELILPALILFLIFFLDTTTKNCKPTTTFKTPRRQRYYY